MDASGQAQAQVSFAFPADLSKYLQEIATKRFLASTLRHNRQHFHVRIAGVLPARNKMQCSFRPIDPPVYRLVQVPSAFRQVFAPPPLQMRVIALAIVRPLLKHVQHKTKCWQQKMMQGACYPRRAWTPKVAAPHRTSLSPQSNEDRGLRLVQGGLSPRSYGNHLRR